jgi:hypothetical protein
MREKRQQVDIKNNDNGDNYDNDPNFDRKLDKFANHPACGFSIGYETVFSLVLALV